MSSAVSYTHLSATMQDISENASVINTNTDNVAKEVELIAEKTDELTGYTLSLIHISCGRTTAVLLNTKRG